ncbi:MAG: DNA repair and recombination protein RadA [Thermoprotei archaeon]|nr:MAG: DNA repair and recombination protein RadA [Thermoprotei archaeon]
MTYDRVKIEELLNYPGIGRVTLHKLSKLGIEYVHELVLFNPEEIMELANIDIEKACQIIRLARRIVGRRAKALNALEYEHVMNTRKCFTTGVKSIDKLVKGGITVWDICEFAGEYGSGKTQLCHQLAVTVQLPEERGGLESRAVYIDTEGTFSPSRIRDITSRFQLNAEKALKNILVYRPINVAELEELVVEELRSILASNVKLIIIDSIIALYRAEFKGREWLARRQQRINYLIDWLKRYANLYDVAVVYTNQVLSQPVPWGIAYKVPAGGNIIAHAATHRFLLRRSQDKWVIECIDSPKIARGSSATFKITEKGLEDTK